MSEFEIPDLIQSIFLLVQTPPWRSQGCPHLGWTTDVLSLAPHTKLCVLLVKRALKTICAILWKHWHLECHSSTGGWCGRQYFQCLLLLPHWWYCRDSHWCYCSPQTVSGVSTKGAGFSARRSVGSTPVTLCRALVPASLKCSPWSHSCSFPTDQRSQWKWKKKPTTKNTWK